MAVSLLRCRLIVSVALLATIELARATSATGASSLTGTAALENKVKSELHGFSDEEEAAADAAEAYCKAHEMDIDGTTCCKDSTCYWDDSYPMQKYMTRLPDVSCLKKRGDTKCEGGSLFPVPKAGICVCKHGHCVSGKCTNKTAGMMGGLESDFSGLYTMTDKPIRLPGTVSTPLVPYLVCFLMWTTLIFTALGFGKVVRTLRSGAQEERSSAMACPGVQDYLAIE